METPYSPPIKLKRLCKVINLSVPIYWCKKKPAQKTLHVYDTRV